MEHERHSLKVASLLIHLFPYIAAISDSVLTCKCCKEALLKIKFRYRYGYCTIHQIRKENYHNYLDPKSEMRLKHSSPWHFYI